MPQVAWVQLLGSIGEILGWAAALSMLLLVCILLMRIVSDLASSAPAAAQRRGPDEAASSVSAEQPPSSSDAISAGEHGTTSVAQLSDEPVADASPKRPDERPELALRKAIDHVLRVRRDAKQQLERVSEQLRQEVQPRIAKFATWIKSSPIGRNHRVQDVLCELEQRIAEVRALLDRSIERLSRQDYTVAVVGFARVGKTTFLQSLTGLDSDVLPVGNRGVVTGVRVLIRSIRSDEEPTPTVEYHTEDSLLSGVVAPFCDALKIKRPKTLWDFLDTNYEDEEVVAHIHDYEGAGYLAQLRNIQKAVRRYKHKLGQGEQSISLSHASKYISKEADHRWAVVRSVTVDCPMPLLQDAPVTIVDTAGLGELAPPHREQLLEVLGKTANLVLMIRLPKETGDHWSQHDAHLLDMVQRKLEAVGADTPLVLIVNQTPGNRHLMESFVNDVRKHTEDQQILTLDYASPQAVQSRISEVIEAHVHHGGTGIDLSSLHRRLVDCAHKAGRCLDCLTAIARDTAPKQEQLRRKVDNLLGRLETSLRRLEEDLNPEATTPGKHSVDASVILRSPEAELDVAIPKKEELRAEFRRRGGPTAGSAVVGFALDRARAWLASRLEQVLCRELRWRGLKLREEVTTALRALPELRDALQNTHDEGRNDLEALARDLRANGAPTLAQALDHFIRRLLCGRDELHLRLRPLLEGLSYEYLCRTLPQPESRVAGSAQVSAPVAVAALVGPSETASGRAQQKLLESLGDRISGTLHGSTWTQADLIRKAVQSQMKLVLRVVADELTRLLNYDAPWWLFLSVKDLADRWLDPCTEPEWLDWVSHRYWILWPDKYLDLEALQQAVGTIRILLDSLASAIVSPAHDATNKDAA